MPAPAFINIPPHIAT